MFFFFHLRYSAGERRWETLPSRGEGPECLWGHSAVTWNHCMFVFGGVRGIFRASKKAQEEGLPLPPPPVGPSWVPGLPHNRTDLCWLWAMRCRGMQQNQNQNQNPPLGPTRRMGGSTPTSPWVRPGRGGVYPPPLSPTRRMGGITLSYFTVRDPHFDHGLKPPKFSSMPRAANEKPSIYLYELWGRASVCIRNLSHTKIIKLKLIILIYYKNIIIYNNLILYDI